MDMIQDIDKILSVDNLCEELRKRLYAIKQCELTNKALWNLYKKVYVDGGIMNRLSECSSNNSNFSYPIFMQCWEDYFISPQRILYVGRDTNSWYLGQQSDDYINCKVDRNENFELDNILACYRDFNLGIGTKASSGFAPFVLFINKMLWGSLKHYFLHTNVYKIGKRNGSGRLSNKLKSRLAVNQLNNLLIEEIRIVKPDYVFFLTECEKSSFENEIKSLDGFKNCKYDSIPNADTIEGRSEFKIIRNCDYSDAEFYLFPHPYGLNGEELKVCANVIKNIVNGIMS